MLMPKSKETLKKEAVRTAVNTHARLTEEYYELNILTKAEFDEAHALNWTLLEVKLVELDPADYGSSFVR